MKGHVQGYAIDQIGLLDPGVLPVTGVEQARRVLVPEKVRANPGSSARRRPDAVLEAPHCDAIVAKLGHREICGALSVAGRNGSTCSWYNICPLHRLDSGNITYGEIGTRLRFNSNQNLGSRP